MRKVFKQIHRSDICGRLFYLGCKIALRNSSWIFYGEKFLLSFTFVDFIKEVFILTRLLRRNAQRKFYHPLLPVDVLAFCMECVMDLFAQNNQ